MIPIVVLLTFVAGRWWSVPVAAAAWGGLIYADGAAGSLAAAVGAASIAAANAIAAVGARQLLRQRTLPSSAEVIDDGVRRQETHVLSFLRLDPSA